MPALTPAGMGRFHNFISLEGTADVETTNYSSALAHASSHARHRVGSA
jgi:hypothetical protein